MNNISIGRYIPYNSKVHRLDPRLKLFVMVLFMVMIFLPFGGSGTNYMDFIAYGIIAIVIFIIMAIAHVKLSMLFKQLKSIWFLVIILFVFNLLMKSDGKSYTLFNTVTLYYEKALYDTAYIFIRLLLMISLTMTLTATTTPLDLTYAIEWYLIPFKLIKLPTHEIAMTISIALRFIPTLLDETDRIMKAQASRGVDFQNGKFKEKVRAIISLIVPLLVSAFQRSEELANAMEARGYNPGAKRTRYRLLKWKMLDTFALILSLAFFGLVLYMSISNFDLVMQIKNIMG
ncbi:MAG: energy-coupling factor transporter transmembrane protein EcfT [Erysipelotrichales bacterium]|nr:energy-coupling factor transporter transmembrane protein EcfT [Erysipelotrichales bacterium]